MTQNMLFKGTRYCIHLHAAQHAQHSPAPRIAASAGPLQFVADHLASNRAVVPPSIVMRILAHLAAEPAQHAQHAQQAQQEAAQREDVFRDVITHAAAALGAVERQEVGCGAGCCRGCSVQGGAHRSCARPDVALSLLSRRLARPLSAGFAGHSLPPSLHLFTPHQAAPPSPALSWAPPQAVWLARRAGYLQAEARMRELEGAHGEALACLTRDRRCGRARLRTCVHGRFVRAGVLAPLQTTQAEQ